MEDHKTVTPKSCGGHKEVVFEIVVGKKSHDAHGSTWN